MIAVGGAALAGWVLVARLLGAVSTLFADQGPAGRNKKDDKKGGDKKGGDKKGGDKKGGDKKAKKGK